MNRPTTVNVLGVTYQILYVDKPSDVDAFKRDSLWGQIDYWTRTIRVYDLDRQPADLWQTVFHEVLHAIGQHLHLDILDQGRGRDDAKHTELDVLAIALVDVLTRNGWGLGFGGLRADQVRCVEGALMRFCDVAGVARLDRPEGLSLEDVRRLEGISLEVDRAMSVLTLLREMQGLPRRGEDRDV